MNSGIPKRIIHVWGGGAHELTLLAKAAIANVKLLNPDFEYLFFDDDRIDDFVSKQFPEYRNVFDSFRLAIQRYDFFRYLAVYHFGGFYFDLDVFFASSLADLLDYDCIFTFEDLTYNMFLRKEYGMDWEIANYAFGAAPGHPFIGAIIKNCVRAQTDTDWVQPMINVYPRIFRKEYFVLCTTGPGLVSRTLAEYPDAAKQVKVLFPKNVCDPFNRNRFGEIGVHMVQGSWRKKKSFVKRKLLQLWWWWMGKKILKESLKLGKKRSLDFRREKLLIT